MFNRIYQTLTNAGLKSYGWDGFGYKDYSLRFSNFSRNLDNAKANLGIYSGGLFAAGTWLLCQSGALAQELCFNYHGDNSGYAGFSSLDGKANYTIIFYDRHIMPFYPNGVAALCHVNYNSTNQNQYDLYQLYKELDINNHLNIKHPYAVLAESGFSKSLWEGHTEQTCNAWNSIDARLCADTQNPIYDEIKNCLTNVLEHTVMQAKLICQENKPKSEALDSLIHAAPIVSACALGGYIAYSLFNKRNAVPVRRPMHVVPAASVSFPLGQEDDAPKSGI